MTSFSGLRQTIQGATNKLNNIWLVLIPIAVLFFIVFSIYVFHGNWFTTRMETQIQTVILGGLKDTSDLNVVKMRSKATVVENAENIVFSIPFGKTKVIYEGVGQIRAGIDMRDLKVKEVQQKKHLVHIILPPPYITETVLDVEASHILDHHRDGISFKSKIELQDQAQKDALRTIRVEACENGIMEAASKNAKELVEKLLHAAGYKEVIIDTQSSKSSECPIL